MSQPMHVQTRFRLCRLFAAAALSLGCAPFALAALGGTLTSIQADRAHMQASLIRVTHAPAYEVHSIQSPAGTIVNEYLSPEGKVFAVAWHGPFMPEMQQILGAYFQQYSAALQTQAPHYGHNPLNIQQPGLVVQTGGHMRAYFGRAYLPAELPQGVEANEIK